jgi:hypothetical protein
VKGSDNTASDDNTGSTGDENVSDKGADEGTDKGADEGADKGADQGGYDTDDSVEFVTNRLSMELQTLGIDEAKATRDERSTA